MESCSESLSDMGETTEENPWTRCTVTEGCLAGVKPNFVTSRRLMIEKIAAHLAEFTPRLQSNTRALYQYCPIPVINYPQLENELFCNIYYLKHLCDTLRFPDWPIKDPVSKKRFRIHLVLSESWKWDL